MPFSAIDRATTLEDWSSSGRFTILLKIAKKIEENVVATVKAAYMKMETLSEYLFNKLILVDRVTKVTDMEKAVEDLNGAIEAYYEQAGTCISCEDLSVPKELLHLKRDGIN